MGTIANDRKRIKKTAKAAWKAGSKQIKNIRKLAGKKVSGWIKKLREEEQLDELDRKTLISYRDKAQKDKFENATKRGPGNRIAQYDKRNKGEGQAKERLLGLRWDKKDKDFKKYEGK